MSSLRVHVFRTHKIVRDAEDSENNQEIPGTSPTFNDFEETFDSEEPNISFSEKICGFRSLIERHFALFCLKLQEKHILPKTVRHTITHEVKILIELFNEQSKDLLKFCLEETNINIDNHSNLKSLVEDNLFGKCFDVIASDFQFERYCIREFGLIEPVEYLLGFDSTGRKETFQYIPILEVLKNILKRDDVFHYVVEDTVFDGETLKDFTDGLIFQQHAFFDGSETQLRLQLYTDEFEIVNCLGSKRQIHKILSVYFVLGNIPLKYRSSLQNIHVAVLVRNRLLQKYSYEQILDPLLRDLCELQCRGVSVDIDDKSCVFKGSVISICADNLSAHSLAGFNTCFSQGRICRFCLCHHRDIGNKTEESECILRTPDTHRRHLQVPDGKSLYGVTGRCPFDKLPHFEVTESFPPDLMHDILEGVIPQVLKLVLLNLTRERLITVQQFNEQLQQFPFGQNDITHRPVLLKPSALQQGAIPGKAVEKLTLFRLLPFLIGSSIPQDNTYWALYLLFRSICDIVLAPVIKTSWLSPLSALITEFLKSFQKLFPDKFTPKIHFLVHYPRLIKQHGPLRAHWCLRYEAKHLYFKRLSSIVNNYQNIAKTLAKRYQMRQCWEAQSTGHHVSEDVPYSLIEIRLNALPSQLREIIAEDSAELNETLWKTKQVIYDRVKYTTGDFLILDLVHAEEIPVFLKVIHIVKYHSQWKLCGRLYQTWCFSEHLHAYGVRSTTQWVAITPGEETDFHALDAYTDQEDNLFITLLHRPVRYIKLFVISN